MPTVEEINDVRQLASLSSTWHELLSVSTRPNFFQTPEWLEVYWKHYGAGQRLRLLLLREGGRPLGLMPLAVRTEASRVGRLRVLSYPLHDWGTFYGPIGADPDAILAAGLRHVAHTRRDWDLLDLRWVNPDGSHGDAGAALRGAGFQVHQGTWDRSSLVDLSGGWDAYWAGFNRKKRNSIMGCEKKLAKEGELTWVHFRPAGEAAGDGDPRLDLYDTCLELAGKSWQSRSEDGTTLCHGDVREFLREAHVVAARAGAVALNLLYLDGRPAAFSCNYHYRGYVFMLRVGFDPEVSRAGSGTALTRRVIQRLCEAGDHTYDLGPGTLEVKARWKPRVVACHHYTHYPLLQPRAQAMRIKRAADRWLPVFKRKLAEVRLQFRG